jgi:hypothetical protein
MPVVVAAVEVDHLRGVVAAAAPCTGTGHVLYACAACAISDQSIRGYTGGPSATGATGAPTDPRINFTNGVLGLAVGLPMRLGVDNGKGNRQ